MPFFMAPGVDSSVRRLLLISWHFPPAQTAGALRWQKLAGHAARYGWQLDVVTADPSILDSSDERRLVELPPGTRVYGIRPSRGMAGRLDDLRSRRDVKPPGNVIAGQPGALRGARRDGPEQRSSLHRAWNAWLAFSNDRIWAQQATALGRRLLGAHHQAVISCGPPHMAHQSACTLGAEFGLPAILDLRDPWASRRRLPDALNSPLWFALADRYEARAAAQAAMVIANTGALATALQTRYERLRVITVMNGVDYEILPEVVRGKRFVLAYAGAIYLDRDPRPLFRAAATVVTRLGLEPSEFGIEFVGNSSKFAGSSISELASTCGVGAYFKLGGRVPREEALRFLARAQMLVSLPQDSQFAIPSKVFEYMQYQAWLLALADTESPVACLLQGTSADVVSPTDEVGIAKVIERRVVEWSQGRLPPRLADDMRFGRASQAQVLFEELEDCLARWHNR